MNAIIPGIRSKRRRSASRLPTDCAGCGRSLPRYDGSRGVATVGVPIEGHYRQMHVECGREYSSRLDKVNDHVLSTGCAMCALGFPCDPDFA